jgi:hypothetical protein
MTTIRVGWQGHVRDAAVECDGERPRDAVEADGPVAGDGIGLPFVAGEVSTAAATAARSRTPIIATTALPQGMCGAPCFRIAARNISRFCMKKLPRRIV